MKKDYQSDFPERFIDETLAEHWRVDKSEGSFKRLLDHIENTTNFRSYFEKAISHIPWDTLGDDLIIADIGSGVGWTSAILAMNPKVKKVYSIEPSLSRANRIRYVVDKFGVDINKVEHISGSFENIKLPEKIDYAVICASFHHCVDELTQKLFDNIKDSSKNAAKMGILIANEHYVTPFWTLKMILAYYLKYNRNSRKQLYWGPGNWREPHPYDKEHWRIKKECRKIFSDNSFKAKFFIYDGDLCKDKKYKWETFLMWRYYCAVLDYKT